MFGGSEVNDKEIRRLISEDINQNFEQLRDAFAEQIGKLIRRYSSRSDLLKEEFAREVEGIFLISYMKLRRCLRTMTESYVK